MLDLGTLLGQSTADYELSAQPSFGRRYSTANGQFNAGDAGLLTAFLAWLRPNRMIEIGSGHSTFAALDACQFFDIPTHITAIEPNPERLLGGLGESFPNHFDLIESRVQDVPTDQFAELARGDVLFIDSSHVAKSGSDVVYELLQVVPRLLPGVLVHVHDIFPAFEYPQAWLKEGRYWSEAYLLRALLTYNSRIKVKMWPVIMGPSERRRLYEFMPIMNGVVGGSIWLEML
jgi:predicted O-methyltransferase YrrM